MDEFHDYEPMTFKEDKCKKLAKIQSIIDSDPGAQLVMIAVPKGFDVSQLNNMKESSDEKSLDLRRKLRKIAKTPTKKHIAKCKIVKDGKKAADQCTLDIACNQSVSV